MRSSLRTAQYAMSIKSNLRELSNKEASHEDVEEFWRQVAHETNERGACILMATNVDRREAN
jgi:hypothetical protein